MSYSVMVYWGGRYQFDGTQDAVTGLSKKEAGKIANIYAANPNSVSVDITTYDGYNLNVKNVYKAESNVIHINPQCYPQRGGR